jgi:hypothetical protein
MSEPTREPVRPVTSRDEAGEFAERTIKNYHYLKKAQKNQGAKIHVVTHLANSLLGLVIFPWEDKLVEKLADKALASLTTKGKKWPEWNVQKGKEITSTLRDLLKHLRNAIAHRHLRFSSDSAVLREVELTVEDYKANGTELYWRASINCEDLETFCELLAYEISELR